MTTINIEVTDSTAAYWIAIDDKDVDITNSKGATDVASGDHIVAWWMLGNAGSSLKFTIKNGAALLTSVDSTIPDGKTDGGGIGRFQV